MDINTFKSEVLEILRISWPMMLVNLIRRLNFTTSASFCGNLSKEQIDALSLANTFLNMFGSAAVAGMNTACYTIFAQISGSQNTANMGIILRRGVLVFLLSCVPTTALFINAEHLMVLTGQNEDLARNAGKYLLYATAGLPAMATSSVLRSFTYTQGHIHVHYLIPLISYILNVGLQFLLLDVLELETSGAGLAICLSYWLFLALYLLFISLMTSHDAVWYGWTIDCVDNLSDILRLAIPGMIMTILEWGVFDVLTFLVGLFGEIELAAYSITYYLSFIITIIPVGLSNGVSIRVGRLLGANKPDLAKCACMISLILAPLVALLFPTVFLCLRQEIPYLFTRNRKVKELTSTYLLWMAPQGVLMALQVPTKGVLRGLGQQAFGAVVNVISCVLVGLPVAMSVMFETDIGIIGAYAGMILVHSIQSVMCIVRLSRVDWYHEAMLAQERSRLKTPEEDKAVVPDEGSESTPKSQDDQRTVLQKHSDVLTSSKGYGAVASSLTGKHLQKKSREDCRFSDEDDLTSRKRFSQNDIWKRKRFLWYKLVTIVSVCLIILGAAVCLNKYFTE